MKPKPVSQFSQSGLMFWEECRTANSAWQCRSVCSLFFPNKSIVFTKTGKQFLYWLECCTSPEKKLRAVRVSSQSKVPLLFNKKLHCCLLHINKQIRKHALLLYHKSRRFYQNENTTALPENPTVYAKMIVVHSIANKCECPKSARTDNSAINLLSVWNWCKL